MSFDNELKKALDNIEVPEELLPHNIEAMLRSVGKQEINTDTDTAAHDKERSVKITVNRTNRAVIMRTLAAAAACIALAAGFTAFREESAKPAEIESEIEYEAVQVQSYDELYSIYTGIYLNSPDEPAKGAENGDGVEIITDEDTANPSADEPAVTETTPAITEAAPVTETEIPQETIEAVRSDFSDADIVKSNDKCIYYICGGTLYAVSKEDMAVIAEISGENAPFEMYVRDNALVLISEVASDPTDSSEHTSVCVDIYDIADGAPVRLKSYKQNGVYTSARIDDSGILYLVTGYSDYRAAPLDENADLESYVPAYYIDGEKSFVAAENIVVPPGANNTDYTVISAVKCSEPVKVTVKAVLGSSADAYCSENVLYVASAAVKDGVSYTNITSFDLSESGLAYKANGSVDGELISRYSMCEFENGFRIACRTYNENGMITTNIYTLDNSLAVVSEANGLLPGVIASAVKFDGSYASIFENSKTEPVLAVDLNQSAPAGENTGAGFMAAYVNSFGDELMVGISAAEKGGLKLELYSAAEGVKINEICFADIPDVKSPALTDRKAMLIDVTNGIIGIPVSGVFEFGVKNQYYIFGCDANGFTEKGVFEYNDLDDSYRFDRAVVTDGVLYIIGSGRMVSVSLADMTVIETFDF